MLSLGLSGCTLFGTASESTLQSVDCRMKSLAGNTESLRELGPLLADRRLDDALTAARSANRMLEDGRLDDAIKAAAAALPIIEDRRAREALELVRPVRAILEDRRTQSALDLAQSVRDAVDEAAGVEGARATSIAGAMRFFTDYARTGQSGLIAALALAFFAGILGLVTLGNHARHRFEDCLTSLAIKHIPDRPLSERQVRGKLAAQAFRDFQTCYGYALAAWVLSVIVFGILLGPCIPGGLGAWLLAVVCAVFALTLYALASFYIRERVHMDVLSHDRMGCGPRQLNSLLR